MAICTICNECKDLVELNCSHEFCHDCLLSYLRVKIQEKDELLCPQCDDEINLDNIKNLLKNEKDLFLTYSNYTFTNFNLSNMVMCPHCKQVCVKNSKCNRTECKNGCDDFCEVCGLSHLLGKDWIQCPNIENMEDELDSIRLALSDLDIKKCPLCKIMMERVAGCNSMKCVNCKLKFCWSCLQSSSEIKRMKYHECDNYGTFLETDSDSDYKSGSDYDI